ncbi:MAG: hypothetical protein QOE35_2204 [Actinomycetota bacterium]|jgi:DNA-binding CsgD family transcriptional regulator
MSAPSPALLEVAPHEVAIRPRSDGPYPHGLQMACEVMEQLADDLGGARVAVIVSDAFGAVVETRVADPMLRAAVDRRTADPRTALVSTTARIVDPGSGRLVAHIDIVCFIADESPLMQPLATRAAREIELRMVDGAGISKRLVLQRFLDERRRAKGPMLVLTDTEMITNAAAARLMSSDDEPALRDLATRLMSAPAQGEPAAVELSGGNVYASVEPILEGPTRLGVVLRLWAASEAGAPTRPHRPPSGWDSLTDTERAVTDLAAEGLTNRDIGKQLFLSHHTVGFHLRAIFRKLEITSRVELAGLVTRRALATS